MAEVTIVYWRDIPAQVIVGQGRRASKVQLSERFEQAIDRWQLGVMQGVDGYDLHPFGLQCQQIIGIVKAKSLVARHG